MKRSEFKLKKNIYIINCFETYNERVENVKKYFIENNCNVTEVVSDFQHMSKEKIVIREERKIGIDVPEYLKNISLKRLYSHYVFSKKTLKYLQNKEFDLLYVLIPPNYLVKELTKYYRHKNVEMVFDVIDIWPEAMNLQKHPILNTSWKSLRDRNLNFSDKIITECDYFKDVLIANNIKKPIHRIYFTGKNNYKPVISNEDDLNICYLGSINNIIDIEKIVKIIKSVEQVKSTKLHIIGDGENRERFLNILNDNEINYNFYGKIYDENKKRSILSKCDLGLNIMKPNMQVGLTMKSIEYFRFSLPIINNIDYDTKNLVEEKRIGINEYDNNFSNFIREVANNKEFLYELKTNVYDCYNELFSEQSFKKEMDYVFKGDF